MPNLVLRTRVVLITLLVLVVVSITASGLWIVRNSLRHQIADRLAEDLEHSAQAFSNLQIQRNLELERENSLLSNLPNLKALMTTGDRATIADAATEFWRMSDSDLFALVDNTGAVQVAYARGQHDSNLAELLERAIHNPANHYLQMQDALFAYSMRPLRFGNATTGTVLGYVVNGYAIDARFVHQVSQAAATDAAFLSRDRIFATTFAPDHQEDLASAFRGELQGNMRPERVMLGDEPYLAEAKTLTHGEANPVHLLLLKSFRPMEQQIRATDKLFLIVGALAILVGSALMLLISDRITRPLEDLTKSMRAFGSGDITTLPPQRGTHEIQELNANFVAMRAQIQHTNHALLESERLATIGRMASSVSHDLRHYLASVYANAEFLSSPAISSKERAELFDDIKMAVDGTTELIESLLIFSRTGAAVQRTPILLSNIVERATALLEKHPDAHSVKISTTCKDPISTTALLDARQVERAVYNLLLNACQSGATEVAVRITLGEKNKLYISVEDNGPGVPESIRNNLFEPFVSEGKQKGTGLGLTLAHCIAREHGGNVELLSSRAGETIFLLTFDRGMPTETIQATPGGEIGVAL